VNLWVVVPAYNEAARISSTIAALRAQTDRDFTLLVVDNGSTDETASLAGPSVLPEPSKGVGCAVDTGFRHAIAHGATHIARTDADCLPRPGWITGVRAGFADGGELVCGRITARRDEHGPVGRAVFRGLVGLAATFGRWRPAHRSSAGGFRAPYRMHAGNNMAVTASLYLACGGMPRRPSPTDRLFLNRVRATTDKIVYRRDMVVENSTRRLSAYGVVGTAKWYLDRGSGALTADPR
jgi:glycosyltransferase involved in cell wall biosynthesis